ncbi:MAG: phosphoglycerate dehydrogenase [Pirellulaceae bacterium]|jgi:D-3-phosphoglycerate dehydrogenase|nr:phosphoglycerate dehydrogenase [Pirellulaceae bacterium]MDP7018192.1 phosphoglycerate dehydrogenase [Pirellulaceae bacterium]
MPNVIVLDNIAQEGLALLETAEGIEYEIRTGLAGDELQAALNEFDGAICRSGVRITSAALAGNRKLKAIVRAGVGTDNIDKAAATRQGVVVMNTPTGNTLSTAEHTFTLMLALSRNVAPAHASLMAGRWDRKLYMGAQLADKTLGVIGLGRIGREVAKRALAFQMRVCAYDPYLTAEQAEQLGVKPVDTIDELLPLCDYLTVHVPGSDETKGLIGRDEIAKLPRGARVINCARGGIYDESALLEALESGQLAGAALDVYDSEPCTDSPLFGQPGTLCTPHLGASTEEAQTQVAVEAVHLLVNFLTTGEIRHAVNMAAIDPQTLDAMRGHLDMAYRLGLLLSQWHDGGISTCSLSYRGEVANSDTKLMTASFCVGLLSRAIEDVNIVNAKVLLQERGIQLTEHASAEMGAFSSSFAATVEGDGNSHSAAGTLFGASMPRLIRLGEYRLEAYLDGTLLIFSHEDVPGIIGSVGTTFGAHQVNIGQMSVGRAGDAQGGQAIGVLNLDEAPADAAIDEILQHDSVHGVSVLELPPAGERPAWLG